MEPKGSEISKKIIEKMERQNGLHSGVNEASAAMYHFPELVEMWRLEDWESTLRIDVKIKEYMNPEYPHREIAKQVVMRV